MPTTWPRKFTVWLSTVASQPTFLYSFSSATSVLLLPTTTTIRHDLKLTQDQLDHFILDAQWALFLPCAASGFLSDFVGRRSTLMISGSFSFLGFLLMAVSPSYGLLMTGRIVSLAAIGLGLPATPLYIGEIASPSHRGFLNTIPDILSILGLWFAVVIRAAVVDFSPSLQWRMLVGVGVIPSLLLRVGMIFMPESPSWSIMRGRVADAKNALQRTSTQEVSERLSALRTAARVPSTASDDDEVVEVPPNTHVLAIWREVLRPASLVTTVAKSIISILIVHFTQQATGIDHFTKDAMVKFGFQGSTSAASFELGSGLAPIVCGKLFPIFFPLFFSDVFDRKMILGISMMLSGISLVVMNVSLVAYGRGIYKMHLTAAKEMNLWTTTAFFGSFSTGLGPITWVHTSEVLPFKVRAQVIGLVVMLNRMLSFGITFLPPLMYPQPLSILYWILSFLFAIGLGLFALFFVESRGQSLEVLDELPRGSTIELS